MFFTLVNFFSSSFRARLAVGFLSLAAGFLQAQESEPLVRRAGVPVAPVYSKDGSVAVFAPASQAGYRLPILVFVDRTRETLQKTVRLKLGSQVCPLEVVCGGQRNGDTRVLTARLRSGDGTRERIELPDPEAADLGLFRRAICVALLRAWRTDVGGEEAVRKALPEWLISGVVRYMDRETRQADLDRTLLLWSHGCLPTAAELFAAESLATEKEPAVSAVLAAWLLEKRPEGLPFETLLRGGAATATEWRAASMARLLTGADDPVVFDEALDLWLLSEARQVLQPGVTTKGIEQRFRLRLLLYPWGYGKNKDAKRDWLTFDEAVAHADDPAVRQCAVVQAASIKMAALGRDGMLLALSEAYTCFLEALSKGAKPEELVRLLKEAEEMRSDLERKTASGAVLQRSVEGRLGDSTEPDRLKGGKNR